MAVSEVTFTLYTYDVEEIATNGRRIVIEQLSASGALEVPFNGEAYVGLVWAADSTFDEAARMKVVGALIDSGCRYIVCGGVDCEQWHDDADVAREVSSDSDVPFVMTTSHTNESIEDVVFFATNCTNFDEYDFKCLLVLVVGKESERADFAAQMSRALRAPLGEPNDPSTPAGSV